MQGVWRGGCAVEGDIEGCVEGVCVCVQWKETLKGVWRVCACRH